MSVRDYKDLEKKALVFWPSDLSERERNSSIIPLLISTQEKFISVLHVADTSPFAWTDILPKTSDFPANLFLKHLMVLSDIGGETLKRVKTQLRTMFRDNRLHFAWQNKQYEYEFQTIKPRTRSTWSNNDLGVDAIGLNKAKELGPAVEDVIVLLLHGASSVDPAIPEIISERCIIGSLLGDKANLDVFVRQRYIWVSRITGGATANVMGHLAQEFVKERLETLLPNWDFSKRKIPGISQNAGKTDMAFDIIAESPSGKYCAIEVSFQVTTNSTIERKAGQALSRHTLLHKHNHHIAYVIDGAGNFERKSALSNICHHSDCTVTFKDAELQNLAKFLKRIGK
jgi:hypothetical protein